MEKVIFTILAVLTLLFSIGALGFFIYTIEGIFKVQHEQDKEIYFYKMLISISLATITILFLSLLTVIFIINLYS